MPIKYGSSDVCDRLRQMQKNACQCVPSGELDARLQTRVEDFFQVYDKEMLTKKGRIKDKKMWKAWKGKRPMLYYHLLLKYRRESVQLRSPDGENVPWDTVEKKEDEKKEDEKKEDEKKEDPPESAPAD